MRITSARRSWLFLQGAARDSLLQAAHSGADIAIQDLEDFTPHDLKDEARRLSSEVCRRWRENQVVPAVRITPLAEAGEVDTRAAVSAGADIIVVAKAETGDQIREIDRLISYYEGRYERAHGEVEICPTIESPAALTALTDIAGASVRVRSAILASEDLATNLGMTRTIRSAELRYARSRFLFECAANGILAVDCPFTFDDDKAAQLDLHWAADLGYRAKSVVHASHVGLVNAGLAPSREALENAAGLVDAFEQAERDGLGQVTFQGRIVELPAYKAAKELLAGTDTGLLDAEE
ncbi:HpcH/HpaI aldolase/citrate lyase family protein [Streptomyces chartreusis]|uniref:HpcH/HpaI aldolase/citrate lyase family protein n=1 Tax=Streptomyces chartreusis TaxID=1969 RepID=UPI0036266CF9